MTSKLLTIANQAFWLVFGVAVLVGFLWLVMS
jgi:hypothetical protein